MRNYYLRDAYYSEDPGFYTDEYGDLYYEDLYGDIYEGHVDENDEYSVGSFVRRRTRGIRAAGTAVGKVLTGGAALSYDKSLRRNKDGKVRGYLGRVRALYKREKNSARFRDRMKEAVRQKKEREAFKGESRDKGLRSQLGGGTKSEIAMASKKKKGFFGKKSTKVAGSAVAGGAAGVGIAHLATAKWRKELKTLQAKPTKSPQDEERIKSLRKKIVGAKVAGGAVGATGAGFAAKKFIKK